MLLLRNVLAFIYSCVRLIPRQEYDVEKVVDMLSTDFGRFGVSFTYVNTTYTLNETLTTVTNRKEMYKMLVRPRRLGGYADLNLFWVASLNGAKGTCTLPAPGYLSGEGAREWVVPADASPCAPRLSRMSGARSSPTKSVIG